MENGQPKNLLEKLAMLKKSISETEQFLEAEKQIYLEKTFDVRQKYERENEEYLDICYSVIYVSLKSLLEEFAEQINVKAEDLNVRVSFRDTRKEGRLSKKKLIKKNRSYKITIWIYISTKDDSKLILIPTVLLLDDIQGNGQTLKELLQVETTKYRFKSQTDFICPDYENLVLRFRLDKIVDFDQCDFENSATKTIYRAYERDQQKKLENGETV